MEYRVFTSNLAHLKDIRKSIETVKSRLEVKQYEESGVKGIDYTHIPSSHNPSVTALKRLELVDEVDELTRELNWLMLTVYETESVLNRLPEELKDMLVDVFVNGMTFKATGLKYGYSDNGLWHYLKRETERYL